VGAGLVEVGGGEGGGEEFLAVGAKDVGVEVRQSPGTVETSVVVMLNGLLILWSACAGVGRLGLPAFPASRGRRGSGVKGTPKACRALARCEAPLRP